jgi:prepilin-type N-terminal cleavage/methylation domain-containing protein
MKPNQINNKQGFTLPEVMIASGISSLILGAALVTSIALQKSFSAVDNYFATQIQQMRIVDYLSRDVRRSYIVTSTSSPQTVTCMMPNYIIQAGDSDYNGSNAGTRRTPTLTQTANGIIVDYGARTVVDAVTINNSTSLTSASANFTSSDVGRSVAGTGIPPGTTIQSLVSGTSVTMSSNATADGASIEAVIGAGTVVYSVVGQSILRRENGTLTTIASSTDNLLPSWLDVDLSNTEYLTTSITFLPIFTSAGAPAERSGTTIYSTAYLRNKRRG